MNSNLQINRATSDHTLDSTARYPLPRLHFEELKKNSHSIFACLLLLHSLQSNSILLAELLPPLLTGIIWSNSRFFVEPHFLHFPPSLLQTSFLTSDGIRRESAEGGCFTFIGIFDKIHNTNPIIRITAKIVPKMPNNEYIY